MAVKKQGRPAAKKAAPVDTVRLKRDIAKDQSRSNLAKARIDSALAHHPKMDITSKGGKKIRADYDRADSLAYSAGRRADTLATERAKKKKSK